MLDFFLGGGDGVLGASKALWLKSSILSPRQHLGARFNLTRHLKLACLLIGPILAGI